MIRARDSARTHAPRSPAREPVAGRNSNILVSSVEWDSTGVELVRPWRSVTEAEHLASAVPVQPIGEAARSTVRVVRLAVEAVNDFTTAPVSAVRCVLQSALIYRAIWR